MFFKKRKIITELGKFYKFTFDKKQNSSWWKKHQKAHLCTNRSIKVKSCCGWK